MQGNGTGTSVALDPSSPVGMWDHPPRREAQGDGAAGVLRERERRAHGEGRQVSGTPHSEGRERRNAETILGIIHDRGRRGLPWEDVSRQLCNPQLSRHA
jgi:hypothetical protein